jgi:hypothetical protein
VEGERHLRRARGCPEEQALLAVLMYRYEHAKEQLVSCTQENLALMQGRAQALSEILKVFTRSEVDPSREVNG